MTQEGCTHPSCGVTKSRRADLEQLGLATRHEHTVDKIAQAGMKDFVHPQYCLFRSAAVKAQPDPRKVATKLSRVSFYQAQMMLKPNSRYWVYDS